MTKAAPPPHSSPRLAVVMDPIDDIKPYKDTTLALLLEAQRRGWEVDYLPPGNLYWQEGALGCRTAPLSVQDDERRWHELGGFTDRRLTDYDLVLMRKDPPFDNAYLYLTFLLEQAQKEGVRVINDPRALRDYNEKAALTWFPDCCPPTLISADVTEFRRFLREQGMIVLKPLDAMGGKDVFVVKKDGLNLSVIVEHLTQQGMRHAMAQRYLPEIADGDKRILMINGEPLPWALARIPPPGESRGNLAAGGRGEGRPLSERDRWIAERVGPELRARGLFFVGLDVIGEYLTEINVTSPTCVRELDRIYDVNIAARIFDTIGSLAPVQKD